MRTATMAAAAKIGDRLQYNERRDLIPQIAPLIVRDKPTFIGDPYIPYAGIAGEDLPEGCQVTHDRGAWMRQDRNRVAPDREPAFSWTAREELRLLVAEF